MCSFMKGIFHGIVDTLCIKLIVILTFILLLTLISSLCLFYKMILDYELSKFIKEMIQFE